MGAPKGHEPYEGGGRPVGSRNKNYLDPNFWTEKLYETLDEEDAKTRRAAIFQLLGMLLPKVGNIPLSPGDSVKNAEEIMKRIEDQQSADAING